MFTCCIWFNCDVHASKRNLAALATACEWKGHDRIAPPLDPPVMLQMLIVTDNTNKTDVLFYSRPWFDIHIRPKKLCASRWSLAKKYRDGEN